MDESQWLPELLPEQEFNIFNIADNHELKDTNDNLYGILVSGSRIIEIGTCDQQVARFWHESDWPWHGHPICPITIKSSKHLYRPTPKMVLNRMKSVGLITNSQHRRLSKGK